MDRVSDNRAAFVASANEKTFAQLASVLSNASYRRVIRATSASETRRLLMHTPSDILIIDTPLSDDFGIELALGFSDKPIGVLVLVRSEIFEETALRMQSFGILVLPKPCSEQQLHQAIQLLAALSSRLMKVEQEKHTLQDKMADIRIVNRAKCLLVEHLKMSEEEAHHLIEKRAMDSRASRREIAQSIIAGFKL